MVHVRLLDIIGENTDDFFASLPTDDEDITVELNSPGGDAFAGLAIFNKLKDMKGEVTIDVMGMAASSAALIFMAGDIRLIRENAVVMIHNPFSFAGGDADVLRKRADNLEDLENQVAEIHANATGLNKDKILKMMADETTLNADEAVKLGFATAKVKSPTTKPKNFYAQMLKMGYANVPEEYKNEFQTQQAQEAEMVKLQAIMELLKVDKDTDIVAAITKLQETKVEFKTGDVAFLALNKKFETLETAFKTMSTLNGDNTAFRVKMARETAEAKIDLMISGGHKKECYLRPAQKAGYMAIYDSAAEMGNTAIFDTMLESVISGGINEELVKLQETKGHGGGDNASDGDGKGDPEAQFMARVVEIETEMKMDTIKATAWVKENEPKLTQEYKEFISDNE